MTWSAKALPHPEKCTPPPPPSAGGTRRLVAPLVKGTFCKDYPKLPLVVISGAMHVRHLSSPEDFGVFSHSCARDGRLGVCVSFHILFLFL